MTAVWDLGGRTRLCRDGSPSWPFWRADRLAAELPGAGVAGAAGLLVMSERLARREVARGHGLAYDRNE